METPLARVRGLGSAKTGARHWWVERLTSVSTLLLLVWLLVSLMRLQTLDHATLVQWIAVPVNATAMILLVISSFWHIKLGLQVVVEDYVHQEGGKIFLIVFINFVVIAAAAAGIVSVLKITIPGAAG